jgi:hypothetical protein
VHGLPHEHADQLRFDPFVPHLGRCGHVLMGRRLGVDKHAKLFPQTDAALSHLTQVDSAWVKRAQVLLECKA